MEILEEPESWTEQITCETCKTVLQVDENDVEVSRFVDNSKGEYWFAGHPGQEHFYVKCPTDGCHNNIFVDECPVLVKNRVKGRPKE